MSTLIIVDKIKISRRNGRPSKIRAVEEIGRIALNKDGSYAVDAADEKARRFITAHVERAMKEGVRTCWRKTYPDGKHIVYFRLLKPSEREFAQELCRQLFREDSSKDRFEGGAVFADTKADHDLKIERWRRSYPGLQIQQREE